MADFLRAYRKLEIKEGLYSNHPKDRGGETVMGVARNFWPFLPLWVLVDALKSEPDFPACLDRSQPLLNAVSDFYRREFWDRLLGDRLPQEVADELFEQAVNMGVPIAVRHLQKTLNALNRNGQLYPDISVDGWLGGGTYAALNRCLAHNPTVRVLRCLNVLQGAHYFEIMERNPAQEEFRGWFDRV